MFDCIGVFVTGPSQSSSFFSTYFTNTIFITIDVCAPYFYILSVLDVCWSPVSVRMLIYNVLNVCPFDYTAFVVSGKLCARKVV